ncbi:MAG: pilus assembly FimT family protein [Candidatus Binatia bacterium]
MQTWIATTSEERLESRVRSPESEGQSLQSAIRNPQSAISSGFTLLELSVVLLIIGLLAAVALPQLGDVSGRRLESSARRLAALVHYLSGEAAFSGRVYRLHYDLDQRAYWVTVLTAPQGIAEFIPDSSPLSQPVQLPPAIAFADVFVPGVGRVRAGQVYTHFYPQGYADPTVIHLRDQRSRVVTVTIPPLTGEARVAEGYGGTFSAGRMRAE